MSANILTNQEIDDLLSSIDQDKKNHHKKQKQTETVVIDYNFSRQEKFSPLQISDLKYVYNRFATECSKALKELFKREIHVVLDDVITLTYEEFTRSNFLNGMINIVEVYPVKRAGLISFSRNAVYNIASLVLGGEFLSNHIKGAPGDIESELAYDVITKLAYVLDEAWKSKAKLEHRAINFTDSSSFVWIAPYYEPVACGRFKFLFGNERVESYFDIVVTYSCYENILILSEKTSCDEVYTSNCNKTNRGISSDNLSMSFEKIAKLKISDEIKY